MKQLKTQLSVLQVHQKHVAEIFTQINPEIWSISRIAEYDMVTTRKETIDHVDVVTFNFGLVPYGSLNGLDVFQEEGIAFTKTIADPADREYLQSHTRFTMKGDIQYRSECYKDRATSHATLRKWLSRYGETNPKLFVELLLEEVNSTDIAYDPLPWTHQLAYGKRYQTKRLISDGYGKARKEDVYKP